MCLVARDQILIPQDKKQSRIFQRLRFIWWNQHGINTLALRLASPAARDRTGFSSLNDILAKKI